MKENNRRLDYNKSNLTIQERLQRLQKLKISGKKNSEKVRTEEPKRVNNEEGD